MLEVNDTLGLGHLLSVMEMSFQVAWQEGMELKTLCGTTIPQFHSGFRTGMQAVFSPPQQ